VTVTVSVAVTDQVPFVLRVTLKIRVPASIAVNLTSAAAHHGGSKVICPREQVLSERVFEVSG
jgi:hypothetical protein